MRPRFRPALLFLLLGLATTLAVAFVLALIVDPHLGPQSQAESFVDEERWTVSRWDRAGAVQIRSVRTRGRNWSPQQAAGEPDTPSVGDQVTAWASQSPDGGTEWLVLQYAQPVVPRELHVYESCAPGALSQVATLDDAGTETLAWSGVDPAAQPPRTPSPAGVPIAKVPLKADKPTSRIKIYLASDTVPGWNEIDAVALIDDNGQKQWARHVEASSTYASGSAAQGGASGNPALLTPAWSRLDRPGPGMESDAAKREERLADARGWPLLALASETDLLGPSALNPSPPIANTPRYLGGPRTSLTLSGTVALTTPSTPDVRPPLPRRPIWLGLALNTLFYALLWLAIWATLTVPRRFVRDLARLRRGACIACGYDLGFDFPHGCPECGWRRDPTTAHAAPAGPLQRP